MPKARARRATSRPILPRPITPRVFARSSVPCKDFFSHFPACMVSLARQRWRAMASINARVCSATATALAPGVFMTAMPLRVRGSISICLRLLQRGRSHAIAWRVRAGRALAWTAERTIKASAVSSSFSNLPSSWSWVRIVQPGSRRNIDGVGGYFLCYQDLHDFDFFLN